MKNQIPTIISMIISFLSVFISFMTFKNKIRLSKKEDAKNEGLIISDIGYIKACVERLENTFLKFDERYHLLDIRITKIEEKLRKDES